MAEPASAPEGSGTLRRNVAALAASNMLAPFFSLALVLAISRLRGVEELGKYSLVMTVFVLGQSCAGFGLPLVITREVARARESAGRYFTSAILASLPILAGILAVALPALLATMSDAELCWAIVFVLVALAITSINVYGEAILLAFERAGDFVAINLGETVLRAIIGVALVAAGFGIAAVAAGLLVCRVLAGGAYLVVLRGRGVHFPRTVDRDLCRDLLGHVPVVGMIPIANAIYARADIFLLTSLGSWTDVGLYSAAQRFVEIARTVSPAYARALYPVLARLRGGADAEFRALVQRSMRTTLLITTPVVLALFGAGAPLLTLLYGAEFAAAVPSLRILAWTLVPFGLAMMLAQVLFAANRQAIDLRVNLIASAASVAGGIVLIPRFGATGAAIATLLAATVYAALQYWWTRKHVADPAALGDVVRIAGAAAAGCVVMLLTLAHGPWLAAALGLAAFGALLLGLGVVQWEDVLRVRLLATSATSRIR